MFSLPLTPAGFNRTVPGYPRYQYVGNETIGEHHLVIRGATLEDEGEYECQVGPTATQEAIWSGANVTVMGEFLLLG